MVSVDRGGHPGPDREGDHNQNPGRNPGQNPGHSRDRDREWDRDRDPDRDRDRDRDRDVVLDPRDGHGDGGRDRDRDSWAPPWRQRVGTLHHAQPDPHQTCPRHPGQPSGEACTLCRPPRDPMSGPMHGPVHGPAAGSMSGAMAGPAAVRGQAPGRPGTAPRAGDEETEADAPTPTPPRLDESCPRHPGSRRDPAGGECRGCRADRLAATPSPTERPRYVRPSRVEQVRRFVEGERRRLDRHGGRACTCPECQELRLKVWAHCRCCEAAMHPREQERGNGLCRTCEDIRADILAGRVIPEAPPPPRHHILQARAAIQEARSALRRARSEAIERAERQGRTTRP